MLRSDNTPQYISTYTPEENQLLHKHIEEASKTELDELIFNLCDLYPDSEKVFAYFTFSKCR